MPIRGMRFTERREGDIGEFAGVWKEAEEIEEVIKEGRREFDRYVSKYAKNILP